MVHRWLLAHPRVQLHFTPTYSSWISQVERWFAELQRRCLDRGVFCSLDELATLGLTGALDPGGIGVVPETYEPLYDVWRSGELTLRVRLFLGAGERGSERRQLEHWMSAVERGSGGIGRA